MKTKKEILEMSKEELQTYKWSGDLDSDCINCFDCSNCAYCAYCRNLKGKRDGYYICNVEVTKEEFEKKREKLT